MNMMCTLRCPVCGEMIRLAQCMEAGDTTVCQGCCMVMEVVSLDPVRIQEAALVGSESINPMTV